jgi:hypothetical protein
MNKLVTLAAVAALALVALASPAAAYHSAVDVDECGDAPTKGADILALSVDSKGASGEDGWITVAMALCGTPVKGAKYRVHFDYKDEIASARNTACRTTSDTIAIHASGTADARNGGPVAINIDKTTMTQSTDTGTVTVERYTIVYKVRYKDLGVFAGDDVEVWADIQSNGISDRAPNTNGGDGCAKPQEEDELLSIELVD